MAVTSLKQSKNSINLVKCLTFFLLNRVKIKFTLAVKFYISDKCTKHQLLLVSKPQKPYSTHKHCITFVTI